jgi:hypothetical protein
MGKATCEICKKIFTTLGGLKKHQTKKKPCQPPLPFPLIPPPNTDPEPPTPPEPTPPTPAPTPPTPAIQLIIEPQLPKHIKIKEEEREVCSVCGEELEEEDDIYQTICLVCGVETWWEAMELAHQEIREKTNFWYWFNRLARVHDELKEKYTDYAWNRYWKLYWKRKVLPSLKKIKRIIRINKKTRARIGSVIFEF